MTRVIFVEPDGTSREVHLSSGITAMQGARDNRIPGILGDCGGACSCATCHVFVDAAWQGRIGPARGGESELLSGRDDCRPESRLACQIRLTSDLDGLVLHLPDEQY